jgi:beta-phosphoglucomutase-like phosphatase (HAD superfamily)
MKVGAQVKAFTLRLSPTQEALVACLLLDFDGTLFDTERSAVPSLIERFNSIHASALSASDRMPLTTTLFDRKFRGMARQGLCAALAQHYEFPVDCEELYRDRDARVIASYAELVSGVPIAPNVVQALHTIKGFGWEFGVVSNNSVARARAAMLHASDRDLGMALFDLLGMRIWEATNLLKPDPDVYLRAVHGMRTVPQNCVAVEDSVVGVRSARAAGIATLGYLGFSRNAEESRADLLDAGCSAVLSDFAELPRLARMFGPPE